MEKVKENLSAYEFIYQYNTKDKLKIDPYGGRINKRFTDKEIAEFMIDFKDNCKDYQHKYNDVFNLYCLGYDKKEIYKYYGIKEDKDKETEISYIPNFS